MSAKQERHIAMREAVCADAEDQYFAARVAIDSHEARRIFRAAYERGFDKASIAEPYKFSSTEIYRIVHGMEGGLDGFLKQWGYRQFANAVEEAHGIHEEF